MKRRAELSGKTVVLGVAGGIACYKMLEVTSRLRKMGADVHVIMTESAEEFVRPLTFEVLSQNRVVTDMFSRDVSMEIPHISLAGKADLFVVAPATANIIGKAAGGIADDMLSTTLLATRAPLLFVPAMNSNMYENPVVQRNLQELARLGCHIMEPATGRLACAAVGRGRLPEPDRIVEMIIGLLTGSKEFSGKRFLITAGPTREPFDPVRFISNYSSGKMGYALARRAASRGAAVTLISGPSVLQVPLGLEGFIPVETAGEMYRAVMNQLGRADVLIMAAAVGDFEPEVRSQEKIKKGRSDFSLKLKRTVDILAEAAAHPAGPLLVGFAAESENVEEHAREKLTKKGLDLIVANNITEPGAGFGSDTNIISLIARDGKVEQFPQMDKDSCADVILDRVKELLSLTRE